jgi:putative redox protein
VKLSKVIYTGDLRCRATHLASGTEIITDAPVDNHGKGQSFSPTDSTAVSLATCIMTTIGIAANGRNIEIHEMEADVEKIMASSPRRIAEIKVDLRMRLSPDTPENREKMIEIGNTCPVARSLHPDVVQSVRFEFI